MPWIVAPIASTEIVASCPTDIALMSLSTTSAVTSYVAAATVIAVPVASRPSAMFTAVTVPSIGATRVARSSWASRSAISCSACRRPLTAL